MSSRDEEAQAALIISISLERSIRSAVKRLVWPEKLRQGDLAGANLHPHEVAGFIWLARWQLRHPFADMSKLSQWTREMLPAIRKAYPELMK